MKKYELIWQALRNADYGSLTISLFDGTTLNFEGKNPGPKADMKIKSADVIDGVIVGGDVAFGESYAQGLWDTPNLAEVLTFFTLNAHIIETFFHDRRFHAFILYLKSFLTRNTKRGSKKNIKAHYDLGNDFYELWLDETMTYSSAIFGADENISLAEAQKKKYHNILSKLSLGKILEIGCGWGGFAEEAARAGHKLVCLTISDRQYLYAKQRIASARLDNAVEIKFQDYREEKDVYDNIVSIEMFEAVGEEYWNKYFQTLKDLLKSSGKAILQIITIDERVYKDYKNRTDFIKKHIFPGGALPSKSIIRELAKSHGFEVKSEFDFGQDYAKTLAIWLERFDAKYKEVRALGFNEEFIRKWRFYLCYCIAGFKTQRTDVVQFELVKI